MPKFGKWILTLGLVAATPHAAVAANPFAKLFGSRDGKPAAASKQSNQQVANQIAQALRDARLNRYKMDVRFVNGVCTISGQVATAQEKAQATRTISQVSGVQRVENKLTVAQQRNASPRRRVRTADHKTANRRNSGLELAGFKAPAEKPMPSQSGPSNQQVAEAIGRALKGAGLTGYDMEIQFRDGVAALGGSVSSSLQRSQAEAVVRRVPGVQAVNNQLQVSGAQSAAAQPQPRFAPPPMRGYPVQHPVQRTSGAYPMRGMQPMQPPAPMPGGYQHAGPGAAHTVYNNANLPQHSWPTYASYPNYAQLTYPKQYSASAWPYIGPFYPYPQVPLGWRKATLEWDDGYWALNFNSRTDRWWWFLNPHNWSDRPN